MDVGQPVHGAVYGWGMVPGWGIPVGTRVGNTGSPSQSAASPPMPEESARHSGAGPVGPAGAGVGGVWCSDVTVGGDGSWYHPPGPVGPHGPSLYQDPRNAHLQPKGRDSMTFTRKLVKTTKCRHNMSKRPVIVPIFQNGLQKSALEILRFPFPAAFSPKELMGLF